MPEHIALLPGTDGALALGLMHVLIRDDLVDRDYVTRHTAGLRGAARTREPVRSRSAWPAICGIGAELDIERLAHLYGTTRPALIRANYGLQRVTRRRHGHAQHCLPAGAHRRVSRRRRAGCCFRLQAISASTTRRCRDPSCCADAMPRTINMSSIGRALGEARRPIRAMVSTTRIRWRLRRIPRASRRGFAREDLFTVVLEHFSTDTADYADIVLPATTQLEHLDVVQVRTATTTWSRTTPPSRRWGRRSPTRRSFDCWRARWGSPEPCFRDTDEDLAQAAIAEGWDFAEVRARGLEAHRRARRRRLASPKAASTRRRARSSFVSAAAADAGLDPLPDYIAPLEDTRERTGANAIRWR